jgi:hypothetical protein
MSTFNGGPQGIVTNGLVLYLDAANRDSYVSGSTAWNDLSRSRINGTLTNGPTFDNGNAGTIKFDGSNDYVAINNIQNVDFSTGSFTISFYFKSDGLSHPYTYFQLGSGSYINFPDTSSGVSIGNGSTFDFVRAQVTDGAATFRIATASWGVENFSLLTYVIDRNNNNSQLYKNAQSVGNLSLVGFGTCSISKNIDIGRMGWINAYFLNGKMNNIQIYNRALSATEVLQNYNSTKARFGL